MELAPQTENDENVDKATNTIPVDEKSEESVCNSNNYQVVRGRCHLGAECHLNNFHF